MGSTPTRLPPWSDAVDGRVTPGDFDRSESARRATLRGVPTLSEHLLARLTAPLAPIDAQLAARHPGDPGTRQPVHTCYVPADRLHPDVVLEWGEGAREALATHAPSPAELAAHAAFLQQLTAPLWLQAASAPA